MKIKTEVVIIGGGPSGSICAKTLAERGIKVVILEKADRDRYKPCGGGISTPAYELAPIPEGLCERKIVGKEGGLVVSATGNSVRVGSADEPGYTVYRNVYDRWMMDEAEKADRIGLMRAGKLIAEGTPSELKQEHNASTIEEIFIKLSEGEIIDE